MTHAAYVLGGYALAASVLGAYVTWLLGRTRSLRRQLDGAGLGQHLPEAGSGEGGP